jgi:hypothetical protein
MYINIIKLHHNDDLEKVLNNIANILIKKFKNINTPLRIGESLNDFLE